MWWVDGTVTRRVLRLLLSCLAVAGAACGQGGRTDTGTTGTGPMDTGRTIAWRLDIRAETDFAARIWLNGQAVYSQSEPATRWHTVDVEQPYRQGEHVIQFEILGASVNPGTYLPGATVQVKPGNTLTSIDGVPCWLGVGERCTMRVRL